MAMNPYGLTEKEAQVLRLVDRTRSTGEIAGTVGRSIHTVEAQIKSARRRLGNLDRFRAADLLRQAEADSQTEVNPNLAMAVDVAVAASGAVERGDCQFNDKPGIIPTISTETSGIQHAQRQEKKVDHDPSALKTIALILGVAAAAALLLLAAPPLALGAQHLAHRFLSKQ